MASKYTPLKEHLIRHGEKGDTEVLASFNEVETIIRCPLPPSAYNHRPWWTNSKHTVIAGAKNGWLAAGWDVDYVNLKDKVVIFRRAH
ncbi:MAG: hypothetical protein F4X94_10370 [Dehalococcoidia bacterium]|nr:hypothetical protein [Dehalococcoidia bacterium]